jgi:ubiquinone/menaquinone biosynthesis C-methylase UbiE
MPTEKEIKHWYDKKYASKGVHSMRPYEAYPIVLDYLGVQKGLKLLDVSCGTGFLLLAAAKRGLETFGIDISQQAVRVSRMVSPNSEITVGRGEDLQFDEQTFDYVTCLGSLEHFLDMDKGLQEMRRVAKDDATFCIVVPNSNFIFWRVTGNPGTAQQEINEHLLSLEQWKRHFTQNGYEIVDVYQDRWYMRKINVFSTYNPLRMVKRAVQKLAWVFVPLNFTYQFIFILKKRNGTGI